MSEEQATQTLAPVEVLYCGICTFPVEFCEFGKPFRKCLMWLKANDIELYNKFYPDGVKATPTSSLSTEKEDKIAKDLQKMQLKEEKKQIRELENMKNSKILIKRIPRTKHKNIISIAGLEILDIDMKKLAKTFASKFATGASVTKNAEKKDEIVIQGDVGDEVEEYLNTVLEEKKLTAVKIEQVDEKKPKKKTTQ